MTSEPYSIELRFDAVNDRAAMEFHDAIRRLVESSPGVVVPFNRMNGRGNAGRNWGAIHRVKARQTRRAVRG